MEQYLELIRKKKEYIERLIQEDNQLREVLKTEEKKKLEIDNKNANLYVHLNQYQFIDQENSVVTYSALVSSLLFGLSIFSLYTLVQMGFNVIYVFISFLVFNIVQGSVSFLIFKIAKKYFKNKRKENENNIQAILDDLNQLRKTRLVQEKRYNELYQKQKKIKETIYLDEQDIDFISKKIIDALLSVKVEQNFSLEDLNLLIEQEIDKSEQTLIDTDLIRKLK